MTHEQPCPPAGVCGGAAGDGVSDFGTCHASDAVLAAVVSRPGQYQSVTRGDGNGLDASGVHWHDELRHLASAARGLSLVDGGTDHPSGDDQFVADSDVRVDIDGGVYDQQRGDHGQQHRDHGQSDVSGARGRSHGHHLCNDVCQCRGGHDAVSVGRPVRTSRVARILPVAEYDRLVGTQLETVVPVLPPEGRVLVVEEQGQILACCAVYPLWHIEGLDVRPQTRRSGLQLLAFIRRVTASLPGVVAWAQNPRVEPLLEKLGAQWLVGKHYAWKP